MINKMNSILSMKVKHLVWKNHTSSSMILGYVVYNIVCSHSTAVANDPVYMLIITSFCLLMPFCFIISYKVYDLLFVCFFLFGGNACYLIVSDQQKYLKCMLCLICIEMWFKVCLKNKLHCKKKKKIQA